MSKNTSITLGAHFEGFIADQLKAGRYASVSEIVREGLRLLETRELEVAALRAALVQGEQSGPSKPFDVDAFLAEKRASRT